MRFGFGFNGFGFGQGQLANRAASSPTSGLAVARRANIGGTGLTGTKLSGTTNNVSFYGVSPALSLPCQVTALINTIGNSLYIGFTPTPVNNYPAVSMYINGGMVNPAVGVTPFGGGVGGIVTGDSMKLRLSMSGSDLVFQIYRNNVLISTDTSVGYGNPGAVLFDSFLGGAVGTSITVTSYGPA